MISTRHDLRRLKAFCLSAAICVMAAAVASASQEAARRGAAAEQIDPATQAGADSAAAAAFMGRFGGTSRDSLLSIIRNDYSICVGDPARISQERLIGWKTRIDSLVMHSSYAERFRSYVAATGIKAHDVRPCEPIIYAERREREMRELDSALAAQKALRERLANDSASLIRELNALKANPADILNIPAGISKSSLQTILSRSNVRTRSAQNYLMAERINFNDLVVTIAFYFDDNNKYAGYEIETEAVSAAQIDKTVREWAARFTRYYEERLGPPNVVTRVGFRDIRQGRLSIISNWEKGPSRPKVLVGLATHNHLYYAKVMVNY